MHYQDMIIMFGDLLKETMKERKIGIEEAGDYIRENLEIAVQERKDELNV